MNPRLKIKREDAPLFDFAAAKEAAERKRDLGMRRAAEGAENVDPGFHERALSHVERYARTHDAPFLTEDIRQSFGEFSCDGRAWGGVMRMAQARGFIVADGAAPANSSNRSYKTRWKSKLCGGGS